MPTAEVIAIGTELLLGEIQDTNTAYLARSLRDAGIDLYRATIIGDNPHRIAGAIREALNRADIVFTTGGLGPTVDDPTRQAVAEALGTGLEYRPELWEQIQDRFRRFNRQATENNRKQAYIPAGALPVENPVGTAPAFIAAGETGVVISLPGVPREMEYLYRNEVIPYLQKRFNLDQVIRAYLLHTAGVGESQVDEWIGDLEQLANPTVGLAAHPGQIDIRITAKGSNTEEVDAMIRGVAREVVGRLGEVIFGDENQTLPGLIVQHLLERGEQLVVVECGLQGSLLSQLKRNHPGSERVIGILDTCSPEGLDDCLESMLAQQRVRFALGASLGAEGPRHDLRLLWLGNEDRQVLVRSYGGPPQNAPAWAANSALDFARRCLMIPARLRYQEG